MGPQRGGLLSGLHPRHGWGGATAAPGGPVPAPATTSAGADNPTAESAPHAGNARRLAADIDGMTAPPPAIPGARLSPEQLEPLGHRVDNSRRLAVVDERLNKVLATLPPDRWFVERHVVFAAHPIPFLVLGETGVFALWGMSGPLHWRDVPFFDEMAANVKNALPGYAGPVQVGVCRAFEPQIKPRWWYRAEERRDLGDGPGLGDPLA